MKVYFSQIYIRAGVNFPFSSNFQRYLSETITGLVLPSSHFVSSYGKDFKIVFNVSAKKIISDNGIKGPTVFRETKDVEYSIFLPFDVIASTSDVPRSALTFLLKGACTVFDMLEIDPSKVVEHQESMIEHICADPTMFKKKR